MGALRWTLAHAACIVACLGIVLAIPSPLQPPKERIAHNDVVQPLYTRKAPEASAKLVTKLGYRPDELPSGNLKETTIGNSIEHRHYEDYDEDIALVFPGMRMHAAGKIFRWELYTGRNCRLEAQVYRPRAVPKALDQNNATVNAYTLVGYNILDVPELGKHTFEIDPEDQIALLAGDVIGIHTSEPGCVSYSSGGSPTLYRYGMPGHNELRLFEQSVVFVGDGVDRSYSIACTGMFESGQREFQMRESPTPTVSPSGVPSPSPSVSRSPSMSTGATRSTTPTATISESVSASPTTSPSISVSSYPSVDPRLVVCAKGVDAWCKNIENMRLCGMTPDQCDVIMQALYPTLPSPFPSRSPTISITPTPSPSQEPAVVAIAPSPSPSASNVEAAYLKDSENDGLSEHCHYCNGGSDWTSGQCSSGKKQSPIALKFGDMEVDAKMDMHFAVTYNVTYGEVVWNDYSFVIKSDTFGSINIDGKTYVAERAVIRAPSEHKLEGSRTPMEIQIFHRVKDVHPPQMLAVAVLFEETAKEVPPLDFLYQLKNDEGNVTRKIVVDLEDFLSDLKPLAFYEGSLTQPPCTEGITWAVAMGASAEVSYGQMKALNGLLKNKQSFANGRGNNRMTQPLNERTVTLRSNCGISGSPSCERGLAAAANVPEALGGTLQVQDEPSGPVDEGLDASDAVAATTFAQDDVSDGDALFDDGDIMVQ